MKSGEPNRLDFFSFYIYILNFFPLLNFLFFILCPCCAPARPSTGCETADKRLKICYNRHDVFRGSVVVV